MALVHFLVLNTEFELLLQRCLIVNKGQLTLGSLWNGLQVLGAGEFYMIVFFFF